MNETPNWLQLFENVSNFYRHMLMLPLWQKHPGYLADNKDALAIFLEGYAFERQGRSPNYSHAAVDSLIHCCSHGNMNAISVWNEFRDSLDNQKLNHRNNPLYPSSNPDNKTNVGNKKSAIELVSGSNANTALPACLRDIINHQQSIGEVFKTLKSIRGIGDKIASFYLRDLVSVLKIDMDGIPDRYLAQPIDIWIRRTVKTLADDSEMKDSEVAKWIVDESARYGLNPEFINMGIWFYCARIAGSQYRLNQSLANLAEARSLIEDFRMRINSVCRHCQRDG